MAPHERHIETDRQHKSKDSHLFRRFLAQKSENAACSLRMVAQYRQDHIEHEEGSTPKFGYSRIQRRPGPTRH
jgi:hypothetical protein